MALLSVQKLEKSFGANELFKELTFEVQENEKVGLIGINGSGKSTLFKIISGQEEADGGVIAKSNDLKIGIMEQQVIRQENITLYEEAVSVFHNLMETEKELSDINRQIDLSNGDIDIKLIERQMILREIFEKSDGLTYKNRTKATLQGLGFTDEELSQPVHLLSGGEKSKLQLGKLLLSKVNLLLLDEPTNHLDLSSYEWLERFLSDYKGAVIVISHDRYFLDKIATKIIEIENSKINSYSGNYSVFVDKKEKERVAALKKYQQTTNEINRIEKIIEQQKRWNQAANYVTIASKQKSIDRLTASLEKPESAPETLKFNLAPKEGGGNDVLAVENLSFGFKDKDLFKGVNIYLKKGERAFLLGGNGVGKTTLFQCLLNNLSPKTGTVTYGSKIKVGYYDQIQQKMVGTKSVLEELWDHYPKMKESEVRGALGKFLFKGDDVFKEIGCLSGGEKARISLLKLMLGGGNLLFLDEPTNHLDMPSREALESALLEYGGTLLIVSHDRYLIQKLATKIYELSECNIRQYEGNYEYYLSKKDPSKPITSKEKDKFNSYHEEREKQRKERLKKGKIERLLLEIEELEKKQKEITNKMSDPNIMSNYEEALRLSKENEDILKVIDEKTEEWVSSG